MYKLSVGLPCVVTVILAAWRVLIQGPAGLCICLVMVKDAQTSSIPNIAMRFKFVLRIVHFRLQTEQVQLAWYL